jgi:hypothetical protein
VNEIEKVHRVPADRADRVLRMIHMLTDEQAEELRDAICVAMADAESRMKTCFSGDPDYIEDQHKKSVLSDILHLLEIA